MRERVLRIAGATAIAALFATVAVVGTPAGTAEAQPPHGHMLVLHPVVEAGQLVGFHRCVDVANNRALRLNAHHAHLHTGAAGDALRERAGHAVVPTAPLTLWANCAALEAALPVPAGP